MNKKCNYRYSSSHSKQESKRDIYLFWSRQLQYLLYSLMESRTANLPDLVFCIVTYNSARSCLEKFRGVCGCVKTALVIPLCSNKIHSHLHIHALKNRAGLYINSFAPDRLIHFQLFKQPTSLKVRKQSKLRKIKIFCAYLKLLIVFFSNQIIFQMPLQRLSRGQKWLSVCDH